MKRLMCLLLALCLGGCAAPKTEAPSTAPVETEPEATRQTTTQPPKDPVEELLETMTLEEKVGQCFLARIRKETAESDIARWHLGGLVLFGQDFDDETPDSMRTFLSSLQEAARIGLLLAVDEEGGTVNRVSGHQAFRPEPFPSPRSLFESGGLNLALSLEGEKGYLLHDLGLNVNLAPVCDITVKPESFLYSRSLGADPVTTGKYAAGTLERLNENGVGGVMKHFPGYGENGDTHVSSILDRRSLEELEGRDLVPFAAGIETGLGAVMVSHNRIAALDEALPASLSPFVIGYLRNNMGYDRVVITDDLSMGALDGFTAEQSALLAVKAGADLLCSTDFDSQIPAVVQAVQQGEIKEETIDAAVRRVLTWKLQLGVLE